MLCMSRVCVHSASLQSMCALHVCNVFTLCLLALGTMVGKEESDREIGQDSRGQAGSIVLFGQCQGGSMWVMMKCRPDIVFVCCLESTMYSESEHSKWPIRGKQQWAAAAGKIKVHDGGEVTKDGQRREH